MLTLKDSIYKAWAEPENLPFFCKKKLGFKFRNSQDSKGVFQIFLQVGGGQALFSSVPATKEGT